MLLEGTPFAVDSFNHNEPGLLFFCSHCHGDHMVGLGTRWNKGFIHCSPITGRLLCLKWPSLKARVKPLSVGETHQLVPREDLVAGVPELSVCLIDANHIPGSTMFAFVGIFGRILYTGDFRLSVDHAHLSALPLLHKGLDRIYLDNTFCHPMFMHPERAVATQTVIQRLCLHWPCLVFISVYQAGKEDLLVALAKYFQTQIFMEKSRVAAVQAMEMEASNEAFFTQQVCLPDEIPAAEMRRLSQAGCIWAVQRKILRTAMNKASAEGVVVRGIIPSGWTELRLSESRRGINEDDADEQDKHTHDDQFVECDDGVDEISYSDHCSFLELVQFLSYLPVAPTTFIEPVPSTQKQAGYSYLGEEGVFSMLDLSGVPSVTYELQNCSGPGTKSSDRQRVTRKKGDTNVVRKRKLEADANAAVPRAEKSCGRLCSSSSLVDLSTSLKTADLVRLELERSRSLSSIATGQPCPQLRMARSSTSLSEHCEGAENARELTSAQESLTALQAQIWEDL